MSLLTHCTSNMAAVYVTVVGHFSAGLSVGQSRSLAVSRSSVCLRAYEHALRPQLRGLALHTAAAAAAAATAECRGENDLNSAAGGLHPSILEAHGCHGSL